MLPAGARLARKAAVGVFALHFAVNWPLTQSPLYNASAAGDLAEVRRLLAAGAPVNVGYEVGPLGVWWAASPMHAAASNGHGAVITALIKSGAFPGGAGATCGPLGVLGATSPMWKAANRGHAGAVSALLDGGASPTYGKTGKLWLVTSTPLERATKKGHARVAAMLQPAVVQEKLKR
jgi:hypothetical protein